MFNILETFNPNLLIILGLFGLIMGITMFLVFLTRRIYKLIGKGNKKTPGLLGSLRNLTTILLITAIGGMLLFIGFFFIAYHNFTYEKRVAVIEVEPISKQKSNLRVEEILEDGESNFYKFEIAGDQWMIEGDILKWDDYINFLGLHTRYRLNRIRGRYLNTKEEIANKPTVYSLIQDEDDFLWNILYDTGQKLPFVNSVYGNAAFQMTDKPKKFEVFVTTSGFELRKIEAD